MEIESSRFTLAWLRQVKLITPSGIISFYFKGVYMEFHLRKLDLSMGEKEYEMFQDIPAKENGSTNLCFGIPFENFKSFLESQMAREFNKISEFDTPTIVFIAYINSKPIGYFGVRTKINKQWKKWSGNIYYAIRKTERNKHYATKFLKLTFEECQKLGMKVVYLQSAEGNIASQKVIENNNCILIKDDGTRYYKKVL